MEKVMVIGCCGSGKSTFSKKLHSLLHLPLIHLDRHYWKPNWEERASNEWKLIVEDISKGKQWIIDGNYGGTMHIRFEKADTIVFLDYTTLKCLWRITKRTFKYWRKVRPDMPDGCNERFDLGFFHYVATYNLRRRKSLYKKLGELSSSKEVIILKNDKEVKQYFKNLL